MRIFIILFSVLILSSTDGTSDELEQRSIAELVEAAKQAKDRQDDKLSEKITGQIYERITGADPLTGETPEGVTSTEFHERLCTYRKITSSLHTPSDIDFLRHVWRQFAHGLVRESEIAAPFRAFMSCAHDNGDLVPEAKALRDGVSWAKKLKAANMDEAREMAREYEELFEQYPNRRIYMGVHIYISVADLIRRETYEGIAAKNAGQFSEEDLRFQWDLVKSAQSGDLASQLELAKHLEAGDRFIQGNAKAYYWYKRVLQNGGGQSAQSAMDRLHPQLSEFDLGYISFWTKLDSDPF